MRSTRRGKKGQEESNSVFGIIIGMLIRLEVYHHEIGLVMDELGSANSLAWKADPEHDWDKLRIPPPMFLSVKGLQFHPVAMPGDIRHRPYGSRFCQSLRTAKFATFILL